MALLFSVKSCIPLVSIGGMIIKINIFSINILLNIELQNCVIIKLCSCYLIFKLFCYIQT